MAAFTLGAIERHAQVTEGDWQAFGHYHFALAILHGQLLVIVALLKREVGFLLFIFVPTRDIWIFYIFLFDLVWLIVGRLPEMS